MGWSDIVTQVGAQLNEGIEPPIPVLLGAENLKGNGAFPRIVFVPTRDHFGPAENQSADPPQLATRFAGCEVHVWGGPNFDDTEELLDQVWAAIFFLGEASFEPGEPSGWAQKHIDGGLIVSGKLYVLTLYFKVPVTAGSYTTAEIESIPQTNDISMGGPPPTDEDAG